MNKKYIMIADDDVSILDSMQLLLEESGYKVFTTVDGDTVMDMQNLQPDLLLLDIWLSGWDGRDICKHLKSQASTRDIPVIMVSANRDTEKISKEAGADDFISKPFDLEDLLKKIQLHIK